MKQVRKTALVWYTPQEMFDLVTDVERYPAFLPWCPRAEVLERSATGMLARIHLAFGGVRQSFSTRNQHEPGRRVHLSLVDGPFSTLEGDWRFEPLGDEAAAGEGAAPAEPRACRITFDMRYDFSSRLLAAALSPVFDRVADTFVDAFVRRAEQVHGPR